MPSKEEQDFPENHANDPIVHLDYVRRQLSRFEQDGWSIRIRPKKTSPPTGKDLNVRIVGPNPEMVEALTADIYTYLSSQDEFHPS